jgi:hypothetical protein
MRIAAIIESLPSILAEQQKHATDLRKKE